MQIVSSLLLPATWISEFPSVASRNQRETNLLIIFFPTGAVSHKHTYINKHKHTDTQNWAQSFPRGGLHSEVNCLMQAPEKTTAWASAMLNKAGNTLVPEARGLQRYFQHFFTSSVTGTVVLLCYREGYNLGVTRM